MKPFILALPVACLFCCFASAQEPATPSDSKPAPAVSENYIVTLAITDKEQASTEMSIVVCSSKFSSTFADAKSNVTAFSGTLTPEQGGTILIDYGLSGNVAASERQTMTYKNVVTQASVRLKLGEPVEFLKTDSRICTLTVSRPSDQQPKGK